MKIQRSWRKQCKKQSKRERDSEQREGPQESTENYEIEKYLVMTV